MLVFVLSFNSIGTQRDPVPAERGPLTRLFEAGLKLQGARRVDELGERILAEMRTLFRFDEMYFVLVDRERASWISGCTSAIRFGCPRA
jgi:hypothetical protein